VTTPPVVPLTIVTKPPMPGAWVSPRVEINGYPAGLSWGANTIGVVPGVHHIRISMSWIWRYGDAEITVDNRVAPAPPIYYAPPWVSFGAGAIGVSPVKNPKLAVFLAIFVVPLALIALCCGIATVQGS
jgi:hypothetical protein